MSQYAYILVIISLVVLFLVNKYEKEKLQGLLQEQLLKDETFRAIIKEKIQTSENKKRIRDSISRVLFYFFRKTTIPTSIRIPNDAMVP